MKVDRDTVRSHKVEELRQKMLMLLINASNKGAIDVSVACAALTITTFELSAKAFGLDPINNPHAQKVMDEFAFRVGELVGRIPDRFQELTESN
jgi:hypothetical protein